MSFGAEEPKKLEQEECEKLLAAVRQGHLDDVKSWINVHGVNVEWQNHQGGAALMLAAENGHLEIVKFLAETCGANIEAVTKKGWTALMISAQKGHLEVVKYLAETCGANIEAVTKGGWTALMISAQNGHLEIVKYLAETCGARVDAVNVHGLTALMVGSNNGHLEVVKYLAGTAGANVEAVATDGSTALMAGAQKGRLEVVKYLAETCGARVDAVNIHGLTALMLAAEKGHLHLVKYLAETRHANVNAVSKKGSTALMFAVQKGDIELVKYLAGTRGANVDAVTKDGWTALMIAAERGYLEVVKYLLESCRASVGGVTAFGSTALMLAAAKGHLEVIKYLVEICAVGMNEVNKNSLTAFMIAAKNAHLEVVKYLVENCHANVEVLTEDGLTSLMLAAQEGNLEVVAYLAKTCGANVEAVTTDGWTALMLATEEGNLQVVEYLAKTCGANVDAVTTDGWTALMLAAQKGHLEVVKYLVESSGASVEAVATDGGTALMLAAQKGHLEVVKYLVESSGASVEAVATDGGTALMLAAENGHLAVVQYLSETCRANVEAVSTDGSTALILGAHKGHLEVVKYLAGTRGANVEAVAGSGATALIYAAHQGYLDVVKYLAETCHANIEAKTKEGNTSLMLAVEQDHLKVVEYLVNRCGANVEATNDDDETPLIIAARNGLPEIAKYLVSFGRASLSALNHEGETALGIAAEQKDWDLSLILLNAIGNDVEALKDHFSGVTDHLSDSLNDLYDVQLLSYFVRHGVGLDWARNQGGIKNIWVMSPLHFRMLRTAEFFSTSVWEGFVLGLNLTMTSTEKADEEAGKGLETQGDGVEESKGTHASDPNTQAIINRFSDFEYIPEGDLKESLEEILGALIAFVPEPNKITVEQKNGMVAIEAFKQSLHKLRNHYHILAPEVLSIIQSKLRALIENIFKKADEFCVVQLMISGTEILNLAGNPWIPKAMLDCLTRGLTDEKRHALECYLHEILGVPGITTGEFLSLARSPDQQNAARADAWNAVGGYLTRVNQMKPKLPSLDMLAYQLMLNFMKDHQSRDYAGLIKDLNTLFPFQMNKPEAVGVMHKVLIERDGQNPGVNMLGWLSLLVEELKATGMLIANRICSGDDQFECANTGHTIVFLIQSIEPLNPDAEGEAEISIKLGKNEGLRWLSMFQSACSRVNLSRIPPLPVGLPIWTQVFETLIELHELKIVDWNRFFGVDENYYQSELSNLHKIIDPLVTSTRISETNREYVTEFKQALMKVEGCYTSYLKSIETAQAWSVAPSRSPVAIPEGLVEDRMTSGSSSSPASSSGASAQSALRESPRGDEGVGLSIAISQTLSHRGVGNPGVSPEDTEGSSRRNEALKRQGDPSESPAKRQRTGGEPENSLTLG